MRVAAMRQDRFVVEERPRPVPQSGDVLVKVRACGICGSDLHFFHHYDGLMDVTRALGGSTAGMEENRRQGPVLGHEFVCEVVDYGPDTNRALEPGQKVCSMPFLVRRGAPILVGSRPDVAGAYAEYMLLTEAMLLPVDEAMPDEAAALVEPVGIAIHAVNKARIGAGDVAVVVGCGPVGLTTIAVLKARGCEAIIASDLSPRRRQLASAMGATVVVDAAKASVIEAAAKAAPGAPLVVFESTGARNMLGRLVLESPANTRIIGVGISTAEESFYPMAAIAKEIQLTFVIYYAAEEFAEALDLMRGGAVDWRTLVTGKVGLDGVTEAFAALSDPEVHAKILIDPWSDARL